MIEQDCNFLLWPTCGSLTSVQLLNVDLWMSRLVNFSQKTNYKPMPPHTLLQDEMNLRLALLELFHFLTDFANFKPGRASSIHFGLIVVLGLGSVRHRRLLLCLFEFLYFQVFWPPIVPLDRIPWINQFPVARASLEITAP